MSRILTLTGVILLTLALVNVTQQRPRGYGNLRVCPPGQNCRIFRVESEEMDGKKYYVLRHYPDDEGVGERPTTPNKEDGGGHLQPLQPTYIIGGPFGKCPEGQLPDHSGICRDVEF